MSVDKEFEREHLRRLKLYQQQVEQEYYNLIERVMKAATGLEIRGQVFRITDYPSLAATLERELSKFRENMGGILLNGIEGEWALSEAKNDALLLEKYGKGLPPKLVAELQAKSQKAFSDFVSRRTGKDKLTLSDRVWKLSGQLQGEIEKTLFAGISEGKSAARMAADMKNYLNEPDKLFRRVRDAGGTLRLSKAAEDYKPGTGTYRSSYKNALRLTANETNVAYRTSDHERWKATPFVLGVEIRLSNSHPKYDICDKLVGIYPPNYKHTGFHVRCLCYAVPVLPSDEEYEKYIDSIYDDADNKFRFSGKVKDVPDNFKQWVQDNQERMKTWKNPPQFLRDNPKLAL